MDHVMWSIAAGKFVQVVSLEQGLRMIQYLVEYSRYPFFQKKGGYDGLEV